MRTNYIAELKSIILATVVAVLVWTYAEGESLTARTVGVNILIPSDPSSALMVTPTDPAWKGDARVRLEGSTRTIDEATNALAPGLRLTPGAPGVPSEPGRERTIDLREAISAIPELKGLGSSVADVDPQYIRVNVVQLDRKELPVRVELGVETPLDGEPVPQPASATIRAPKAALDALPDGAQVIAFVAPDDLRRLKGDGTETVVASLRPPAGLAPDALASVTPETVTVKLRIRRKVETIRITSVPVWVSLPPTEGSKWNVEVLDPFLTDLSFTGVTDDVQRVRSGQLPIKAMVELSTDELERGVSTKAVSFPGLPGTLAPTLPSPNVRLKIVRREGAAPGQ